MKLIEKIIQFFKRFGRKRKIKKIEEIKNKYEEDCFKNTEKDIKEEYNKVAIAKAMKNTSADDERIIEKLVIRKLSKTENEYLKKKAKEFNINSINKTNYKNYCLGTKKYKNKVYSIISLYRITKGKRSDFKYILVFKHIKNDKPDAKMKNLYSLYIDFHGEPYFGNYYRLFKNQKFLNKIWKKIEKLHNRDEYNKKKITERRN